MSNPTKFKKLKLKRNFNPSPINDGDELFPNGIFEFNITLLLTTLRSNPDKFQPEQVELSYLRSSHPDTLNESTILKADISVPIILAEISPGGFNVIDGNHRLEKARRVGVSTIPAYRVTAEQHIPFLTSERAYEAYINYWNSKINDLHNLHPWALHH